jgi:hypothetical protein
MGLSGTSPGLAHPNVRHLESCITVGMIVRFVVFKSVSCVSAAMLVLATASIADAYAFQPTAVPEARKRANAWIKEHPKAGEGYFLLGAIEASAWAKGTDSIVDVASFGSADQVPFLAPWYSVLFVRDPQLPITDDSIKALRASVAAYRKAADASPKNAQFHLALGWALEEAAGVRLDPATVDGVSVKALTTDEKKQCAAAVAQLASTEFATREKATQTLAALLPRAAGVLLAVKSDDPEVRLRLDALVAGVWQAEAVRHYRAAYTLRAEEEVAAKNYDGEGDATVCVKAGQRLLQLLPAKGGDPNERQQIEETVRAIKAKPTLGVAY